ncbi:MAG: hypothetical protein ACLGGV_09090 [Bacteroidia bacterium]
MRIFTFILLFFVVVSCQFFQSNEPEKTKLARVGTEFLYYEDIEAKLPEAKDAKDSTEYLDFFIQNWINDQLTVSKSRELLSDELTEIEEKVNNYRKSLLVHAYEQAYVQQNLDTNVTNEEIAKYYEENKSNFELKDFIVKALYFKIKSDDKIAKKADKWYLLNNYEDDLDDLYKNIAPKIDLFYYDTVNWIYFRDIRSVIPITYNNTLDFLKYRKTYKITEEDHTFYLNILDYKLKDDVSPLAMEEKRIRNIILNKRIEVIRKQLRIDLYENAKKTGQIETFKH